MSQLKSSEDRSDQDEFLEVYAESLNSYVFKFQHKDNNCVIVKVPTENGDALIQDVIIMQTILSLDETQINLDKTFFLKFDKSNQCLIDFRKRRVTWKVLLTKSSIPSINKNSLFQPSNKSLEYVLMTYGIEKPINLLKMMQQADNYESIRSVISNLSRLFAECMKLAEKTGFSHGDLHAYNILFDHKTKQFVLIDYGRSFINDVYIDNLVNKQPKNLKELDEPVKVLDMLQDEFDNDNFIYPSGFTRKSDTIIDIDPKINRSSNIYNNAELNKFMMSLDIAGLAFKLFVQYIDKFLDIYNNNNTSWTNLIRFIKDAKCQSHLVFDLDEIKAYTPEDDFVQGLRHFFIFCDLVGYVKNKKINGDMRNTIHLDRVYNELFHWDLGIIKVQKSNEAFLQFKKKQIPTYFRSTRNSSQTGAGYNILDLYDKSIDSLNGQDPWKHVLMLKNEAYNGHDSYGPVPNISDKWYIYTPQKCINTNVHTFNPRTMVQAGGRSNNTRYIQLHKMLKPSKVYIDVCQKPFIRLKNKKVYLSDIRGRYKNLQ